MKQKMKLPIGIEFFKDMLKSFFEIGTQAALFSLSS